jgi:two-component system, LuxR family, response regulator FixJ
MVYIIEDDLSVRRAFEIFLESLGQEFKSFESAISFLSDIMPGTKDIIVLDINLPGMSGLDLLDKFAQEKLQIPVIVVTAFDDVQAREACMQYGVKAYLRKPVNGTALVEIIKKYMPVN